MERKHHLMLINVGFFSVSQGNRRRQCPQSKLEIFQIHRDSVKMRLHRYNIWCVNLVESVWPQFLLVPKNYEDFWGKQNLPIFFVRNFDKNYRDQYFRINQAAKKSLPMIIAFLISNFDSNETSGWQLIAKDVLTLIGLALLYSRYQHD